MDRSLWAVMAGTFTLRFSTGLTGAMLAVYLAKLPEHGGPHVDSATQGMLSAAFFLSELVLSPVFGVLSDRFGHHRVMLLGPAFGIVAVVLTGITTNIALLGATRLLEGASTAASVPSILGYIALATATSEVLRGKAAARFEGATLGGFGVGIAAAPLLFAQFGPAAFFLNGLIYCVSFLIYRYGVEDRDREERAARLASATSRMDLGRYKTLLRTSHVWLLAPTWIAVNASIGLWTSQSIFQFSRADPRFPDQFLLQGFSPGQISLGAVAIGILFAAGLIYWGNRFKSLRRTTIILYGVGGGALLVVAAVGINHSSSLPTAVLLVLGALAVLGLFVLAGATPAAIGLLADVTEAYPEDRGAIMGLYSVFLGLGQIAGSLIAGGAATALGLDGIFVASLVLLVLAVVPLLFLRRHEHYLAGPATAAAID